jgi:Thioesterase-like superfamily
VSTRVRRVGRSASFVTVALTQGDDVCAESVVTVGSLSEQSAPRYQLPPFDLPPVGECLTLAPSEGMAIHHAVDLRWDPRGPRWWEGEVGPTGELRAWARLNDGVATWDAWNLLFLTDALLPATVPLGSTGWVPTLQLTSYIHRIPRSPWLRVRQWISSVSDGVTHEHCEIFDEVELVATASQLALVRFPQGQ